MFLTNIQLEHVLKCKNDSKWNCMYCICFRYGEVNHCAVTDDDIKETLEYKSFVKKGRVGK